MSLSESIHVRSLMNNYPNAGTSMSCTVNINMNGVGDIEDETNYYLFCTLPNKITPSSVVKCEKIPSLIETGWDGRVVNPTGFEKSLHLSAVNLTNEELEKWNDSKKYGRLLMAYWKGSDINGRKDIDELNFRLNLNLPKDEFIDYSQTGALKLKVYFISEIYGDFTTGNRGFSLNVVPTPPELISVIRKESDSLSSQGPLNLSALIGHDLEVEVKLKEKYLCETMSAEIVNLTALRTINTKIIKKNPIDKQPTDCFILKIEKPELWLLDGVKNEVLLRLTPTNNVENKINHSIVEKDISSGNYIFNTIPLAISGNVTALVDLDKSDKNKITLKVESNENITSGFDFTDNNALVISYDECATWQVINKEITNQKVLNLDGQVKDLSKKIIISYCDKNKKPIYTREKLVTFDLSRILVGTVLYNDDKEDALFEPASRLMSKIKLTVTSAVKLPEFTSISIKFPDEVTLIEERTVSLLGEKKALLNADKKDKNKFDFESEAGLVGVKVYAEGYANTAHLCKKIGDFTFHFSGQNATGNVTIKSNSETTIIPHFDFLNLKKFGGVSQQPVYNKYSFIAGNVPSLLDMVMLDIGGFYEDVFKKYSLDIEVSLIINNTPKPQRVKKLISELHDGKFTLPDVSELFAPKGSYQLLVNALYIEKGDVSQIQVGRNNRLLSASFEIDNSLPSIIAHPLHINKDKFILNATVITDSKALVTLAKISWTDLDSNEVKNSSNITRFTLTESIGLEQLSSFMNPKLMVKALNGNGTDVSLSLPSFKKIIDCSLELLSKDGKNVIKTVLPDILIEDDANSEIKESDLIDKDIVMMRLKVTHKNPKVAFNSLAVTLTVPEHASLTNLILKSDSGHYSKIESVSDSDNTILLFTGGRTSDSDTLNISFKKGWMNLQSGEDVRIKVSLTENSKLEALNRQAPVVLTASEMSFTIVG